MSLIAVGSAKASPGSTSLAAGLSMAWQKTLNRQAVLVEADGDGGILAARFGLASSPSLLELSGTARHELSLKGLQANCQPLIDQVLCLVAPGCSVTASTVLASLGPRLAEGLSQFNELDAIVDVGRIRPNSAAEALTKQCSLLVVVTRPEFDQLVPLAHLARTLEDQNIPAALVCIGDRPYPPTEMAKTSGLDLLGVMAYDERVGQALLGGWPSTHRQRRLLLWRTLEELSKRIHQRVQPSPEPHVAT
ncbi:MAG: hypothetical protein OXF21_03185 [bacterium]|nr:hypothetical protein [bacterium]